MARRAILLDGPFDLRRTLSPLVRGNGDRTVRVGASEAWWTTRTADGPATLHLSVANGALTAEAWGAGAELAIERAGRLVGVESGRQPTSTLATVDHGLIAGLARRLPGVRTLRTEAVFDALVAAIVEQKVTGTEAHRVWHGLVRTYGEPAPGPAADLGLRLLPAPGDPRAAPLLRLPPARPRAAAGRPHPRRVGAGRLVRGDRGPAAPRGVRAAAGAFPGSGRGPPRRWPSGRSATTTR